MGVRKSIKIAPGIKLNLNKKSMSLTAGTKSARITMNSKGAMRASVGIPGTGPSHVNLTKRSSVIFYILGVLLAIIAVLFLIEKSIIGSIFLLLAVFLIFKGRQYSKIASADRDTASN
ncbi:MAG: DUF4236 domain-containing protein [Bacillota bacterium]